MAAEAFVSDVSKELINKSLTSLANHEIILFLGCKEHLQQLAAKLTKMHMLLHSPWIHRLIAARSMDQWLKRVETVLYNAEDVMDKFGFESLRRKVEMNKVHNLIFMSNAFASRFDMNLEVKNVTMALHELVREVKCYTNLNPSGGSSFSEITSTNLDAVELSFSSLDSTSVKQCFVYCSIFPRGSSMERESLIQLWMAQGFLLSSKGKDLEKEDVGDAYFQSLMEKSFFEEVERDQLGNVTHCKMNDRVHDFAQSIARPEISRTLICKVDVEDMLVKFKCLRTLNLSGSGIRSLPEPVGELIHLRYLDISDTKIQELPCFITKLYCLETLRVLNCEWLVAFPMGMRKLTKLRHIYFSPNPLSQPFEVGHMTLLRTLPSFLVGQEKGFRIEELGSLNQLKGALNISNLENVTQVEEAKKANLAGKTKIHKMGLEWKLWRNEGEVHLSKDGEIAECLQPPLSLKSLTIACFEGWTFPSWISLLENLVKVELRDSTRCERLPPLGDLPCLRIVTMFGLLRVKCIGSEFYGSSSSPFPSLKELTLESLSSLKEWKEASPGAAALSSLEKLKIRGCLNLGSAPTHFPSLKDIELEGLISSNAVHQICSKLTTLVSISIERVFELGELPIGVLHNNKELSRLSVQSCDKIMCLGHDWRTPIRELDVATCHRLCCIQGLTVLERLSIRFCANLTALPVLEDLGIRSFRELEILGCKKLKNLPRGIQSCASLESLSLYMCPSLTMTSDADQVSVKGLISLQSLSIHGCNNMTSLPEGLECLTKLKTLSIGGFSRELGEFPSLSSVQLVTSLEKLTLYGWPRLTDLPNGLRNSTCIRELHINEFGGIEALPDWLGSLENLEVLEIRGCNELEHMPSVESMRRLEKLRKLTVMHCSRMVNRCVKDSGAEWYKISHIPEIDVSRC